MTWPDAPSEHRVTPRGGRDGAVLLTGVTGLVGRALMACWLERSERPIVALIRATDKQAAWERLRSVLASLYGDEHAYLQRVTVVAADLSRPQLGLTDTELDEIAERVTHIAHAAASVSLAQSIEQARAVNVAGTRRMLDLAERARARGGLESFSHLSSAYVAGSHDGLFTESGLDVGQAFRNSYERSKYEAEQLVRAATERLPVRVFRPSIVVGERASGWTTSFNVLYYPIRLFAAGDNPPVVPARRSTRIDVVPVDYVADAVFAIAQRPVLAGATYHLVAGRRAATVGELMDTLADYFDRRPPVLVPLGLYMHTLHHVMLRAYRGRRRRALRRAVDYLPYFSMQTTFEDRRARFELEPLGLRPARLEEYFERLLDFAVATDWGRSPVSRAAARERSREIW